jgi:hypothetical protein
LIGSAVVSCGTAWIFILQIGAVQVCNRAEHASPEGCRTGDVNVHLRLHRDGSADQAKYAECGYLFHDLLFLMVII